MARLIPLPDPLYCGCDSSGAGGTNPLISVDEAIRRALALVAPVQATEPLPLDRAHGRVLAAPVRNSRPMPAFDNSAMDGYAFRLSDMQGSGPWTLPIAGRIAAGGSGLVEWPKGSVIRIFTGAPVPEGCDGVVMQEQVALTQDCIIVSYRPSAGDNVRRRGEDIPAGKRLLDAGRTLDPRAMALLAAAGRAEVSVCPKVRIALFSTGSELKEPGEKLGRGQIWNANRYHLAGALAQPWIDLHDLGIVPDKPDALEEMLNRAAWGADLVISTGGVSVGDEDHMPEVLRRAGAEIHVMKLAMKPGKPLTIGRVGRAIFVGLPGNPVSAFVTWHVIGARIAEAMAGITRPGLRKTLVRAGFERRRKPGRCEFLPAFLSGLHPSGMEMADVVTNSVSHRVALLAGSDGLLVIPAETEHIQNGDYLEFIPF